MADMQKFYDDLININLYMLQKDSNGTSNVFIYYYIVKKISFKEKKHWVWIILMWEASGGQNISDYQDMFHRSSNQVSCNHFLPP